MPRRPRSLLLKWHPPKRRRPKQHPLKRLPRRRHQLKWPPPKCRQQSLAHRLKRPLPRLLRLKSHQLKLRRPRLHLSKQRLRSRRSSSHTGRDDRLLHRRGNHRTGNLRHGFGATHLAATGNGKAEPAKREDCQTADHAGRDGEVIDRPRGRFGGHDRLARSLRSREEFRIGRSNRLFGGREDARFDYANVPTVVFSHPPLGTVGLTEERARAAHGDAVKVYTSRFRPMLSALVDSPQRSLFKLVCVGAEERVVGIHLLGEGADEILQGFAVALKLGVTKRQLDDTVAIHPTSAEEVVLMR